ncbi:helix-turn-helix transcriptional regulator [Streptosporangium sp. NPDC051022]|uniref:helix-turn-helix transcriptional regulator n=1 Tax=Streptosporangium sp. NPDC051022 TaxID=3155752 RepID=UPI00342C38F7
MNDVPRLTGATLDILEVLATAQGQTVYGLQIAAATRRPTGTVYPILARLEQRGWLESGWEADDGTRRKGPRRRYYRVTDDGREHIATALRRRERKVSPAVRTATAPPDRSGHPPGGTVGAEQVIEEFVHELRGLRERVGRPSLRQLAARTYYSPAALSEAFAGRTLPSENLLEAIVSACAGDSREWALRRSLAEQSIRYGIWIPYLFQDFYPLGVQWVHDALRPYGLHGTDIEDIAQETLLFAYQHWWSAIRNLPRWTARQARRTALPLLRETHRTWHLDGTRLPALGLDLGTSPPPLRELRQDDIADDVVARMSAEELLRDMDIRTAQVVHLTSHGFTTAEIARRLEMTTAAVEGRRRRARTYFRLGGATPITVEHADYLGYLVQLRSEGGNLSLRKLAARIGYSHTHVTAVFAGATSLPRWGFTARIVGSLNGDLKTARRLWEDAWRAQETAEADSYADVAAGIGDTLVLWKLTDHLEQAGKPTEAVQVWRTAAEAGDTYAMAMTAEFLVRLGDRDKAMTWLRRAAEAGDTKAWQELARLLEQTGHTEETIEVWQHAAATGDLPATHELTRLLRRAGRTEEAVAAWHRASNAGHAEARQELARLLEQSGRVEEAIEIWRQAADADDSHARQELARLLEQSGRVEEAIEIWRQAADKGDLFTVHMLAQLLQRAGRPKQVTQVWRRAAATRGGEAWPELARLLEQSGRVEEAIEIWRQVAGTGDPHAHRELARLLEQTGRAKDAVEIWRQLAGTGDPHACQELARLLEQAGHTEEAIEIWQQVAGTAKDPAERALSHRALARLTHTSLSTLRVEYELRAASGAGDGLALLALVRLLDQEGRHREAEAVLQTAAMAGNTLAAQTISHRLTGTGGIASPRAPRSGSKPG